MKRILFIALAFAALCGSLEARNVTGKVVSGSKKLSGVVVTDGTNFTQTKKNGTFSFDIKDDADFVYIITPSGYVAEWSSGVPAFYQSAEGKTEFVFDLLQTTSPEVYNIIAVGDPQPRSDEQFEEFAGVPLSDIAETAAALEGFTVGVPLGDVCYDKLHLQIRWKEEIVRAGVPFYPSIGNHDHDMMEAGDYDTVNPFKAKVAPTYYSFNIGNVHYVVLDNILCTNTPATSEKDGSGRSYKASLTQEQLSWLKKDLSYVDKSKVLVLTMHAQMYNETGSQNITYCADLEKLCNGYETHVMSAHTHVIWNNDIAAKNIFHHNSGAVCGTWWWTGYYTSGLYLCKDGSPAGYYVYDMNGTDVKWRFKPTGKDFQNAFRTYDRNEIVLSAKNFAPKATSSGATAFEKSASTWVASDKNNYVYFNVFDYNTSWTIEVTENGKKLSHEVVKVKDPLHLVAYEAQRYNAGSSPTGDFTARTVSSHIFRVKASSATSTLEFKLTDGFGNVYTETMTRPKKFSIAAYK